MIPLVFVVTAGGFWAVAAWMMTCPRDRRRARAAWFGSVTGGLGGWALFGTFGALIVFSLTLSVVAIGVSFRPAHRPRAHRPRARRAALRVPELVVRDVP